MYVWCTCWRRLVISDNKVTICECKATIDPSRVRQKNVQVLDFEYPSELFAERNKAILPCNNSFCNRIVSRAASNVSSIACVLAAACFGALIGTFVLLKFYSHMLAALLVGAGIDVMLILALIYLAFYPAEVAYLEDRTGRFGCTILSNELTLSFFFQSFKSFMESQRSSFGVLLHKRCGRSH